MRDLFSDPVGFALDNNMITQEEYRACLRKEKDIVKSTYVDPDNHALQIATLYLPHFNSNSPVITSREDLYFNRADDVLIKQILGET